MDRMKTFLIYALLIVGFFALSILLENGLLLAMYSKINGEFDGYYNRTGNYFTMENMSAKACNVNGYIENFLLLYKQQMFELNFSPSTSNYPLHISTKLFIVISRD